EARLVTEIIHAGDIEQVIEAQVVPAKLRHLAQISRENDEGRFAPEFNFLLQLLAQHFAERREQLRAGHAVTVSRSSINPRFCSRNELSPEIFSWSFINPSRSASGRGGHPET